MEILRGWGVKMTKVSVGVGIWRFTGTTHNHFKLDDDRNVPFQIYACNSQQFKDN